MDALKPPASLLCKLASVIVHADEAAGERGHPVDIEALRSALGDGEITIWLDEMTKAGLAPVKRSARG